jgi:hypothetical protein
LFFSVFTITITEKKVNVKYRIKNNTTDDNPVFLTIKNQINTNISSIRNLLLIETRLCIVWLAGSLTCPLKKIKSVKNARRENTNDSTAISVKCKPVWVVDIRTYPDRRTRISSVSSKRIFLSRGFNRRITLLNLLP